MTGLLIGPSTGWLYAKGICSLSRQAAILGAAGANAAEICLFGWDGNDERMRSLKTGETFDARVFGHRSLHLPDVGGSQPELQYALAREALACSGATMAVTHPLKAAGVYPAEQYRIMIAGGIPLALENMDVRKDSGFDLVELATLVKITGCRFVLDVQHAYEHDPEMRYADDLLGSLKDELHHLHVSGEVGGNCHARVCVAANAGKILEFVGRVLAAKNVPLILEGEYATADELRQEIEFLTQELGFR